MSDMQDRLRRLVSLREQRTRPTPPSPEPVHYVADFDAQGNHISSPDINNDIDFDVEDVTDSGLPIDELMEGYEVVNAAGVCYCAEQAIPLEEARGPNPLGNLLASPPAIFDRFHPTFKLRGVNDYHRAAFIDTETTGLGGGAGVYCFMVGVGTFEAYQPYAPDQLPVAADPSAAPTHFVVRQFFMRNPAEELALLVALAELLDDYEMTVTFNGRSFDLPLLRVRYTQNRRFLPLDRNVELLDSDRPHLDLLMPARRLWRRRLQSCRLINLEQMILGLHRAEDDVPGHLIPELYQHYVQTGHSDAMRRVFYHNHEDIVTMVALADQLSSAFGDDALGATKTTTAQATARPSTPPPSSTVTGMDWAGIGRAHQHAGDEDQAVTAYTRALESVANPTERAEILQALGNLYKRQKQWTKATETWQTWITSVPGTNPTPYVELAKYCEWETRDLEQAEMWTAWAMHNLQKAKANTRNPVDQRDLQHRLARIQRKRAARAAASL